MKRDNKKALYESIMASVAKEVKKILNENNFIEDTTIQPGLDFIAANKKMQQFFDKSGIHSIFPTRDPDEETITIGMTIDSPNVIIYNPKYMQALSGIEQAYAILFCCQMKLIVMNNGGTISFNVHDQIELNKRVNRELLLNFPELAEIKNTMHGFFD